MATKHIIQKWPGIETPAQPCDDSRCPFHGATSLRGRSFVGEVVSDKAQRTATVQWSRRIYIRKYERYTTKHAKVSAHNPDCINAKKGDKVLVAETRPLSKTKHFSIISILNQPVSAHKQEAAEQTAEKKPKRTAKRSSKAEKP